MFGVMGMGGAFMQAAGAHKGEPKPEFSGIKLFTLTTDPKISSITGTDIVVKTTKGGVVHEDTYASLEGDTLSISADKNTEITITGTIIECEIGSNTTFTRISVTSTALTSLDCSSCYALQELNFSTNTALTSLSCNDCYALQELNLSTNTALTSLSCNGCYALQKLNLSTNTALTSLSCFSCYALQELNLSTNTALTSLSCNNCSALQELNLSTNTALTQLNCSSCTKLVSISYPATNEDVATAIAGAITDATAADGTVYTDSAADYYSTIADAATAKGWTIEQL